jgi:hypothetical protein
MSDNDNDDDNTIFTPALRNINRRALNAVKHGGYSTLMVLPGEDLEQFKELCTDLEDELKPSGRLEIDAVLTIAKLVWRKTNLNVFRRADKARQTWAPYLIDDPDEHLTIEVALKARLQVVLERLISRLERAKEEAEVGPAAEVEAEVGPAVEVEAEVGPAVEAEVGPAVEAEVGPAVEKVTAASKQLLELSGIKVDSAKLTDDATTDLRLALRGDEITPDNLSREQETLARLDAAIDRSLKRLWQLKAAKQIYGPDKDPRPTN